MAAIPLVEINYKRKAFQSINRSDFCETAQALEQKSNGGYITAYCGNIWGLYNILCAQDCWYETADGNFVPSKPKPQDPGKNTETLLWSSPQYHSS